MSFPAQQNMAFWAASGPIRFIPLITIRFIACDLPEGKCH
jgi:hypothetical protein